MKQANRLVEWKNWWKNDRYFNYVGKSRFTKWRRKSLPCTQVGVGTPTPTLKGSGLTAPLRTKYKLLRKKSIDILCKYVKTICKMHLLTDTIGSKRLLDTMKSFNAACNEIAKTCFTKGTASKYMIQQLVYHTIREKYRLSAQLTIRAIAKTCEAYKLNKKVKPSFKKHESITYDARILTFKGLHLQHPQVSITTLEGRQLYNLAICAYFAGRTSRVQGCANLDSSALVIRILFSNHLRLAVLADCLMLSGRI